MRKRALLYANLLALSAAGGLMLSACGSHTAQSQETTAINAAEDASQSDTSENVRMKTQKMAATLFMQMENRLPITTFP